jgi:GntR family transcriptional regulator
VQVDFTTQADAILLLREWRGRFSDIFSVPLDRIEKLYTIITMIQLIQFDKAKNMSDEKLNFQLDFHSGLPIYTQIANQIQGRVASGTLKPGDQLPTVRALALDLRVNFNTVARAYRILDEARLISTQQGRGTYITEKPPPTTTERLRRESLEGLTQRYVSEALRLGFPRTEIQQIVSEQLKSWKESQEAQDK